MRLLPAPRRWVERLRLLSLVVVALALFASCAKKPRSLAGIGVGGLPPGQVGDPCAVPNTGCACETEGDKVECGSTVSQAGDTLTCKKGTRECVDSKWSECLDTHLEEQTIHRGAEQWRPLALGSQADCPNGYDDCDPYCNYQNDVPDNTVDAGSKFTVNDAGLTLVQTGSNACSTLTIAATTTTMVVSAFSPFTTVDAAGTVIANSTVGLTATITPATCVTPNPGFDTTWTIDKFDRAAISGTHNNDGSLKLAQGIAGPIKVTAYAGGLSATVTINVRVNVVEAPTTECSPSTSAGCSTTTTPNRYVTAANAAFKDAFGTGCSSSPVAAACRNTPVQGTANSTATVLYPYLNTWFPLGMIAPVVQYTYSTTTNNDKATKVSLRYPKDNTLANVTAGTTYFNYSLIVKETNNYRQYADCGNGCAQPLDPQVILPQTAWSAFEKTVRGYGDTNGDYDADIQVQRLQGAGPAVEKELTPGSATKPPQRIHFAGGQLKGTVYYNSYNSTAGGSTATNVVGAVLKFNPGDSTSSATPAVSGSAGKCTICHSVSADGSTLTFASGDTTSPPACTGAVAQGGTYRGNLCSWNVTGTPSMTGLHAAGSGSTEPVKFLWGGPYPDGSFYLNNIWDNSKIVSYNYYPGTATAAPAGLYRTVDGALLASTNTPTAAVTPEFSSDGRMVAYNQGTLTGSVSNPAVVVSEESSCSVPTGTKVAEVEACGQAYGLTFSEVASCPGVGITEVAPCGSSPGGINVSEIESCGATVQGARVAEVSACTGPTLSEISSCGPATGITVDEVSSCPGLNLDEISSCGTASGITVSEVSSCPSIELSEISACQEFTPGGVVVSEIEACTGFGPYVASSPTVGISEISPCKTFANGTGESYEIRNDGNATLTVPAGGWTIRSASCAGTTCATIAAGTTIAAGNKLGVDIGGTCLPNTTGTAVLCQGAAALSTQAYTLSSCSTSGTAHRYVQNCAGAWADVGSAGNDATNDVCGESVEIRNDGGANLDISNWTIKNNGTTTCATVPAATTLTPGTVYRATSTNGSCLPNGSGTVTVHNSGGTQQTSRAYTSTCSVTTAKRLALSCGNATSTGTLTPVWGAEVTATGDDTSNNLCHPEAVELRNDTPSSIDVGNWTLRNGSGTTCYTIAAGTTITSGAVAQFGWSTNATTDCFADGGGSVNLYNASAGLETSHSYSTCTIGTPTRSVLSVTGAWSDAQSGYAPTNNDTGVNFEGIDIRNDSSAPITAPGTPWTVKAGTCAAGTVCANVPAGAIAAGSTVHINTSATIIDCLANDAGTVSVCNGTTTIATTTYTQSCNSTYQRSVRSCPTVSAAPTWADAGTAVNGTAFDNTNNTCLTSSHEYQEWGEIRNDSPSAVTIGGYEVRNAGGQVCFSVPAGTSAAANSYYRFNTNNLVVADCLADTGGTASLYNGTGGGATLVSSHVYGNHNCATTPRHSTLSCVGAWSETLAGVANDSTNEGCGNYEKVEIRNDSSASFTIPAGWTVKAGSCATGTTCGSVTAGALAAGAVQAITTNATIPNCLADGSGTVSICNGTATTVVPSYTYTHSCGTTQQHSALSCPTAGAAPVWSDNGTAVTGVVLDSPSSNNSCAASTRSWAEWVEIRNDTPATALAIGGWEVRSTSGGVCAQVPTGTTLGAGQTLRINTTSGACFSDTGEAITLYNGTGGGATAMATHTTLTGNCGTTPRHAVMACGGTWSETFVGTGDDTSNNTCTNTESVQIRNDSGATIDISGWTLRPGAGCTNTPCYTVPASTTVLSNQSRTYGTTTGQCFADGGGTVSLCNGATQVNSYTYAACNAAAPTRAVMDCSGTFATGQTGSTLDTTQDTCTNYYEWIEIRNDTPGTVDVSSYTVKNNSGVTCLTVPPGTTPLGPGGVYSATTPAGNCVGDAGDTLTVYNGTVAVGVRTYSGATCTATNPKRELLTCAGSFTVDAPGWANDSSNQGCSESSVVEVVEVRNDTPSSVDVSGWRISAVGFATPCVTVPTGTASLATGTSWRGYTSGSCIPDANGTLTLYNGAGVVQGTRAYASTCSMTTARKSVVACTGTQTDNVAGATNDTTNDSCTGANANYEGVDIRNDTPGTTPLAVGGYTIVNQATGAVCATIGPGVTIAAGKELHINTGTCLADGNGTVQLKNGATVVASKAYNYSCGTNHLRSVLSCTGTWTESYVPTTPAFLTTNDTCAASQTFETVEIRNDSSASVDVSGWTVKAGAGCAGTTCATVPSTSPLTSGAVTRVYASGTCLADGAGTVTICNGAAQQATQAYNITCGNRGVLACAGTWAVGVGTTNDSSNDSCSATNQSYEWVELRNDTASAVDISNWTVKVGSTVCVTVPNGTSIAGGPGGSGVWYGATTVTDCFPDAGGTISVYDASGNLQSSQIYTSTCAAGTPKRGLLPCPSGTWSNNNTGARDSSNDTCTFSGSANSSGKTIHIKDFTCGAATGSTTCVGSTRAFSNDRTVVDCTASASSWGAGSNHTACTRPSYPSIMPDRTGILYQHQIEDSDFESAINSTYGALAEIWITAPTNGATPVPLDNLNGFNGTAVKIPNTSGTAVIHGPRDAALALPTGVGSVSMDANWHPGTTTATTYVGNQCVPSSAAANAREDRFNYYPKVSPQEAGGAYWAIFTSRRMYGNVAVSNPWQTQRSDNTSNYFGTFNCAASDVYSPGSGFIETKKLWVSAIDKNFGGSGDPSHPPFYLPGQELKAGNSHGYWASTACIAQGSTGCDTDDDCCNGTGASATTQCKTTNTSTVPPGKTCLAKSACSAAGAACTTSANCCGGLTCPAGGGVCLSVGGNAFEAQTYQREYHATCPTGTRVKWKSFEWQSTNPTGTEIAFAIQTKAKSTDTYLPASALAYASATTSTAAGAWDPIPKVDIDGVLAAAQLGSLDYLLVSMTFTPDSGGTNAPTLKNWRMVYDCPPAE